MDDSSFAEKQLIQHHLEKKKREALSREQNQGQLPERSPGPPHIMGTKYAYFKAPGVPITNVQPPAFAEDIKPPQANMLPEHMAALENRGILAPYPVRTRPLTPNVPDVPTEISPDVLKALSAGPQQANARHAMPGMMQMMKNIANTATDVAKQAVQGGPVTVPAEVQKSRFDMCLTCEFYDKDQGRCTKCGCFMKAKTNIAAATCPVKKWDKYTGDAK